MDTFEVLNLETEYNQTSIEAYQLISTENYGQAVPLFQNLITIAKSLKNTLMELESVLNFGICLFYLGKFSESVEVFESAIRVASAIDVTKKMNQEIKLKVEKLNIRAHVNLVLANIAHNNLRESRNIFEKIMRLVENETLPQNKLKISKLINFNFLGYENIKQYLDYLRDPANVPEDLHEKSVHKILLSFYTLLINFESKFSKDQTFKELAEWISTLKSESEVFKSNKDINGFLFATFNFAVSSLLTEKNLKAVGSLKNKITTLSKIMLSNEQDRTAESKVDTNIIDTSEVKPEKLTEDFRKKVELSSVIFNRLRKFEESAEVEGGEQIAKISDEARLQNISNKQLTVLFIKITLKQLKSQKSIESYEGSKYKNHSNLIKQLEFVLAAIEGGEVDLSDLDLNIIDPEIFTSFRLLYRNLCMIKYKSVVMIYFKKYMFNTLGYKSRKALIEYKSKKFRIFLVKQLNYLRDGLELCKLNYSSAGSKMHFYQLSVDDGCMKIYEKSGAKSYSRVYFSEIKKFSFGICSKNMRKKAKTKDLQDVFPWMCFSIVTKERTLDFLVNEEEMVDKWFYGLRALFAQLDEKKMICSVSYYRFFKLKMRMFERLKDMLTEPNLESESKQMKLTQKVINKAKSEGVQAFSFLKIFLLLLKLKPDIIKDNKSKFI